MRRPAKEAVRESTKTDGATNSRSTLYDWRLSIRLPNMSEAPLRSTPRPDEWSRGGGARLRHCSKYRTQLKSCNRGFSISSLLKYGPFWRKSVWCGSPEINHEGHKDMQHNDEDLLW